MTEWRAVRQVFEQVVDLPADQRAAELGRLCGEDAGLRAQVERLLARDASTGASDIDGAVDVRGAVPDPARLRHIAGYRLVRPLGSGGMGAVFEAVQERPARTVALKVLRTLVAFDAARRRLEYEAETLGRLRHPNVAQVFEAGTWRDPDTGEELPFFAMEFVADALPLTSHADERRLDLRGRLELFLQVCDAVQHGHQQGVMHRDLKPQNVLVGGDGRVKVIDFGIARATDAAEDRRTVQTLAGQVLGTPGFMSPEQIDGDPARIDARADVYGLGATLYALLVGSPPHHHSPASLASPLARVRATPPARPARVESARVPVPPELDWVLLKALAADPDERYPSASDLAADLRRFLADVPLFARPPTRGYLLRKFVRRNRASVAVAGVVLALLVGGTVATSLGWRRALAAEAAADARRVVAEGLAADLQSLAELQSEMFRAGRGDRNTRLVDVLDRAAEQLRRSPPEAERVAAGLHRALARAYLDLGAMTQAEQHFAHALTHAERLGVAGHELVVRIRGDRARLLAAQGELEAAEAGRRAALALDLERFGEGHWRVAQDRAELATVLDQRAAYAEALELLREAVPVLEADESLVLPRIGALTALANTLAHLDQHDEADGRYRAALALAEQHWGAEDPETLSIRNSQALLFLDAGRLADAEAAFRELWQTLKRVRGPVHPSTTGAATNLGLCAERREAYADAEAVYREVLAARAEAGVEVAPSDLITRFNLVVALHRQDGEEQLREALAEVDTLLADARRLLPQDNWRTAVFRQHRGIVLRKLGRFAEAEPEFEAARAVLEQKLGPGHSRTRSNYEETAALFEAWGRADEARRWRAKLGDAGR